MAEQKRPLACALSREGHGAVCVRDNPLVRLVGCGQREVSGKRAADNIQVRRRVVVVGGDGGGGTMNLSFRTKVSHISIRSTTHSL